MKKLLSLLFVGFLIGTSYGGPYPVPFNTDSVVNKTNGTAVGLTIIDTRALTLTNSANVFMGTFAASNYAPINVTIGGTGNPYGVPAGVYYWSASENAYTNGPISMVAANRLRWMNSAWTFYDGGDNGYYAISGGSSDLVRFGTYSIDVGLGGATPYPVVSPYVYSASSQTNDLTKVSTNETRAIRLASVLITNTTTSVTAPLLKFSPTNTTVPAYIWNVEPPVSNAFYGVFGLNTEGSTFNGLFDNVATLGWNQSAGGQRQNSGGTANWLQWEHHYKPYSGSDNRAQDEFHMGFVDLNGNTDRPFFYSMDATNLLNWYATYALDWQTFYLPSNGYGNGPVWMQAAPTSLSVQSPAIGTGFKFDMTSAGNVYLNPYSVPTNQILCLGNSGNNAWAAFYINTKTYGSLSWDSSGMAFNGVGSPLTVQDAALVIQGSIASGGKIPLMKLNDTSGAAGSRNWSIGNFGPTYGTKRGAINIYRGSTDGGGASTIYSEWDTNRTTWYFDTNFKSNLTVGVTGTFTNGVASYRTNAFTTSEITTNGFGHWNSNGSIYISVNVAGAIVNKLVAP